LNRNAPKETRQAPPIGSRIRVTLILNHRGDTSVSEGVVVCTDQRWSEPDGIGARVIDYRTDDGRSKVVAVSSDAWEMITATVTELTGDDAQWHKTNEELESGA